MKNTLFFLVFFPWFHPPVCFSSEIPDVPPVFIAHAGGGIDRQTYTNSLEALNSNYDKGFRYFELDFSWTSDDELVAIHDWNYFLRRRLDVTDEVKILTNEEFSKLKTRGKLTQLNLEDVLKWARMKGDAFIVTDVKNENIRALTKISREFKEYKQFVIPQAYNYEEYDEICKLGYEKVILTLYKMRIDPFEVLNFAKDKSPFAVTMPLKIAETGLAYYLKNNHTTVYVHTVNDINIFNSLRRIGVFGIYTDFIAPP